MNALPSLQTFLYDGWVLRFADGYSNRANSVNPIYPHTENVDKKIEICEGIFKRRALKPVYKITPFVSPQNLDALLEKRNYKVIHRTSVHTLHLKGLKHSTDSLTITEKRLSEEWFECYCRFNGMSEANSIIYKKMLNNLVPEEFYSSIKINGEIIACGMAVLERAHFGLFDITVREDFRKKGYGTKLILDMLKVGLDYGAETAYLQVMLENLPALSLYKKLGFVEKYQYHYRILEI